MSKARKHADEALRVLQHRREPEGIDCDSLVKAVTQLAQDLGHKPWERDPAEAQRQLRGVIGLRKDLGAHVAMMEGPGGMLHCLGNECPHLNRRLQALRCDHEELGRQLEALEGCLRGFDPANAVAAKQIHALAGRLASFVEAHHAVSTSLVMEAYSTDLGVGG